MASLIKRGNTYYIQYYLGGKQRRESLNTGILQIAKEKKRQYESAALTGADNPLPTRTPIADVVGDYVIQTTMKYYTRISLANKSEGLAMLKRITPAVHALKTGTDDAFLVDKKTDKNRGQNGGFLSQEVSVYNFCLGCSNAGETKTASPDLIRTCGDIKIGCPALT